MGQKIGGLLVLSVLSTMNARTYGCYENLDLYELDSVKYTETPPSFSAHHVFMPGSGADPKPKQVDDIGSILQRTNNLYGKSKEESEQLLGTPDHRSAHIFCYTYGVQASVHGTCRSFQILFKQNIVTAYREHASNLGWQFPENEGWFRPRLELIRLTAASN